MTVIVHRIPATAYGVLPECPYGVVRLSPAELASDAVAMLLNRLSADADGFTPVALHGQSVGSRDGAGRTTHAWAALRMDDTIVAVIGLHEADVEGGRRYSIPWLLVDPRERRRRVATGLVRTALAAAVEAGATEVVVETLARWTAASAFWTRIVERTTGAASSP